MPGEGLPPTAVVLVARHRTVWWVRDEGGSPMPRSDSGRPAFPYWSSEARAQRAAALRGPQFRAVSMPVDHWRDTALPDPRGAISESGSIGADDD